MIAICRGRVTSSAYFHVERRHDESRYSIKQRVISRMISQREMYRGSGDTRRGVFFDCLLAQWTVKLLATFLISRDAIRDISSPLNCDERHYRWYFIPFAAEGRVCNERRVHVLFPWLILINAAPLASRVQPSRNSMCRKSFFYKLPVSSGSIWQILAS